MHTHTHRQIACETTKESDDIFFHDGSAYVENPFIYSEIIVTVIATIAHYFSYFSMICFILEETKE